MQNFLRECFVEEGQSSSTVAGCNAPFFALLFELLVHFLCHNSIVIEAGKGSPVQYLNSELHLLLHQIQRAVVSLSLQGCSECLICRMSFLPLIPRAPFLTHSLVHSPKTEELPGKCCDVNEFSVAWLLGYRLATQILVLPRRRLCGLFSKCQLSFSLIRNSWLMQSTSSPGVPWKA